MTFWESAARDEAVEWVETWLTHPALERLIFSFNGPARRGQDLGRWLSQLEDFSVVWDFRAGRERNLVDAPVDIRGFADEILSAAEQLGMKGQSQPRRSRYDAVLILGGLVRACIARPLFTQQLVSSGASRFDRIIALGGHRELLGDELPLALSFFDRDDLDELEAMDAGVRDAFDLGAPTRVQGARLPEVGASWTIREYATASGTPVDVVAAPSSEPGTRRANTADTYEWLASKTTLLQPGADCAIVSTQIYRPFQEADAWRMLRLPHDVRVELVGMDPGEVDPRLRQEFAPHHYLQELRSAFIAMRKLYDAAVQA